MAEFAKHQQGLPTSGRPPLSPAPSHHQSFTTCSAIANHHSYAIIPRFYFPGQRNCAFNRAHSYQQPNANLLNGISSASGNHGSFSTIGSPIHHNNKSQTTNNLCNLYTSTLAATMASSSSPSTPPSPSSTTSTIPLTLQEHIEQSNHYHKQQEALYQYKIKQEYKELQRYFRSFCNFIPIDKMIKITKIYCQLPSFVNEMLCERIQLFYRIFGQHLIFHPPCGSSSNHSQHKTAMTTVSVSACSMTGSGLISSGMNPTNKVHSEDDESSMIDEEDDGHSTSSDTSSSTTSSSSSSSHGHLHHTHHSFHTMDSVQEEDDNELEEGDDDDVIIVVSPKKRSTGSSSVSPAPHSINGYGSMTSLPSSPSPLLHTTSSLHSDSDDNGSLYGSDSNQHCHNSSHDDDGYISWDAFKLYWQEEILPFSSSERLFRLIAPLDLISHSPISSPNSSPNGKAAATPAVAVPVALPAAPLAAPAVAPLAAPTGSTERTFDLLTPPPPPPLPQQQQNKVITADDFLPLIQSILNLYPTLTNNYFLRREDILHKYLIHVITSLFYYCNISRTGIINNKEFRISQLYEVMCLLDLNYHNTHGCSSNVGNTHNANNNNAHHDSFSQMHFDSFGYGVGGHSPMSSDWLTSFDLLQRTHFPSSSNATSSSSASKDVIEEEKRHQQRLILLNTFAYEDFYEMVQLFYELDIDHDDHITKDDLVRYHHEALSSPLIDR